MQRTKLARTLLVLGVATLPACERADELHRPLLDRHARPAVGNLGQTGRPAAIPAPPEPIAMPVVSMQLPATPPPRPRTVRRVLAVPPPPATASTTLELQTVERPLVNEVRRPATGNIPRKCSPCGREVVE
ncbi:MAG TPA: hypothetical protein VFQ53_07565 [Kofleriaceae bacterium]|nr:hypothetical protein [Kofleriaceae bacterium]